MLFDGAVVPIAAVEGSFRKEMRGFDRLPPCLRAVANALDYSATWLNGEARKMGGVNRAARVLMHRNRDRII